MTPTDALATLLAASLLPLANTPSRTAGLYHLTDLDGFPRYIGSSTNLYRRIWSNHCAGDGNSHKHSTVLNAGRLYYDRKDGRSCPTDGKAAKALRAMVAREFGGVRVLELPGWSKVDLEHLEKAVKDLAPPPTKLWNDRKRLPASEPVELVDRMLDRLGWSGAQRAALDRQNARWISLMAAAA